MSVIDSVFIDSNSNEVLTNRSNKLSRVSFEKIESEMSLKLQTNEKINFGYLLFDVKNPVGFEVYYDDNLILKINTGCQKVVPLMFGDDSELKFKGTCGELEISVYGAILKYDYGINLLPLKNCIVKKSDKTNVYSYTSALDIVNNNLTSVLEFDQTFLDIQVVKLGGVLNFVYLLKNDNGVYLYSQSNNYASPILISATAKMATIVPNDSGEGFIVVLSHGADIKYVTVYSDLTISQVYSFSLSTPSTINSFCKLEVLQFGRRVFGVNLDDNTMTLCCFANGKLNELTTKNSVKSRIIVDGNIVKIVVLDGYLISTYKYEMNYNNAKISFEMVCAPKNIWNISDILELDVGYLYYSQNLCYLVSENDV